TDGRQTGVAQTSIGVTGTYGVGLSALAGSASARNLVLSGAGGSVQFGSQAFGPVVADGITVIVFNKATGSHVASTDFATGSSGADAAALADYLDNLPSNAYVAIVGSGSWDGALTDDARN